MRTPLETPRTRVIAALVAALAVCLGGTLRMGTADWGLPYAFHPDEKGFVVWEAMSTEWRGLVHDDWRPRINTYGPLIYETAIALKWASQGGPERAREVAARYENDWAYVQGAFGHESEAPFEWAPLFHLYRLLSGLLGTLAVLFLALAAWRLEGPRAGAVTAVLAATCVGTVQAGHYFTTDALLVFELSLLILACAQMARGGGLRWAVVAGLALGMLGATKLPGTIASLAVPVAIAADDAFPLAASRERELGRMLRRTVRAAISPRCLLAAGVSVLVLRGLHPWLFTDTHAYFFDVPQNRSGLWHIRVHLQETEFGFYDWRFTFNDTTPYLFHLTHTLPYALGTPLLALAGAGVLRGLFRLRPVDRIAVVVAVPTLFLVGNWGVKTLRYIMPMVPGLVLLGGCLVADWIRRPTRPPPWRHLVRRVAGWGTIAWTVAYGLAFGLMFTEVDSRVAAGRFVADRAEAGDVVVVGPEASYTAPLGTDEEMVGWEEDLQPPVRLRKLWEGRPNQAQVAEHLDRLLSDARFLVVDDFYLRRADHPAAAQKAPAHRAFYRALRAGETGWERVATFRRRPELGPLVWQEDEAEILSVAFDHVGIEVYERTGPWRNPLR